MPFSGRGKPLPYNFSVYFNFFDKLWEGITLPILFISGEISLIIIVIIK